MRTVPSPPAVQTYQSAGGATLTLTVIGALSWMPSLMVSVKVSMFSFDELANPTPLLSAVM